MKTVKTILTAAALALVLAACSSNSSTTGGAAGMQETLKEMQQHVDANDSAKVQEDAEELEEKWEKFEDSVKDKQADVYAKVEEPLGALQTGSKQSPLDQATLKDQITKLNEALSEVK